MLFRKQVEFIDIFYGFCVKFFNGCDHGSLLIWGLFIEGFD